MGEDTAAGLETAGGAHFPAGAAPADGLGGSGGGDHFAEDAGLETAAGLDTAGGDHFPAGAAPAEGLGAAGGGDHFAEEAGLETAAGEDTAAAGADTAGGVTVAGLDTAGVDTAAGFDTAGAETAGRETPPGIETLPGVETLPAAGAAGALAELPGATKGLDSSSKASFCLARLAAWTAARCSSISFAVAAAWAAASAAILSAWAAAFEEGEKKDPCAFLAERKQTIRTEPVTNSNRHGR